MQVLPDREFLIWLAGFFDGEGCITMNRIRRGGRVILFPRVVIAQSNPAILSLIQRAVGRGEVYRKQKRKWKDPYEWVITGSEAVEVMKCLLPFLRIKREQAEVFLKLPAGRRWRRVGLSEQMLRERVWFELRELKRPARKEEAESRRQENMDLWAGGVRRQS